MPRPGGPPGPGAIGAPPGPGSSPMVSPGGGAGNIGQAKAMLSKMYDGMKSLIGAFPSRSKEEQGIFRAMSALRPIVGTAEVAGTDQAAARQLVNMGARANPLAGTPSPGIQSGPIAPRPPMGPPPMAGGTPGGED